MRNPGWAGSAGTSARRLRVYTTASAISLTLLACIVAGTSPSPSALLLTVIALVPPIIIPLWLGGPPLAPAGEPYVHPAR